jgi:hypothetical protein
MAEQDKLCGLQFRMMDVLKHGGMLGATFRGSMIETALGRSRV